MKNLILFTSFFLSFFCLQSQTFSEFMRFFNDTQLPVYEKILKSEKKKIPVLYNKIVNETENKSIEAYSKFRLSSELWGFLVNIDEQNFSFENFYFLIFDDTGKLKTKYHLDYNTSADNEFYFEIDKQLNFREWYLEYRKNNFLDTIDSGIIIYNKIYSKDVTTYKAKILSDGKLKTDKIYAIKQVVLDFFDNYSNGEFEKAYMLQKNPEWKDLQYFSSLKLFGDNTDAEIKDIEVFDVTSNTAKVNITADYDDNGKNISRINEDFSLSKIDEKWFINSVKINSIKKL